MLGTFWLLWKSSLHLFICFQHTTDKIYQELTYDIYWYEYHICMEARFRHRIQIFKNVFATISRNSDFFLATARLHLNFWIIFFKLRNKLAIVSYKVRIVGFKLFSQLQIDILHFWLSHICKVIFCNSEFIKKIYIFWIILPIQARFSVWTLKWLKVDSARNTECGVCIGTITDLNI